jgi:zinc/manganese transport system ATP-binding protein
VDAHVVGAAVVVTAVATVRVGVATIALDRASFAWRGRPAVRNVSGRFEPGSMTAIIGPNGAGKSTLIKGVMGVLRPASGAVRVTGAPRDELAWLPQAGDLDRSFPVTVLDMVAMGAWRRTGAWRRVSADEVDRTYEALAAVGMAEHANRIIGTLSGGQMQRALFARLLLQDAHVLLLDEPFTAIDSHTTEDLMRVLEHWHEQGRSVIAVLHDMDLVRDHFPQTLLLAGEVVAWGPTADVLTRENLMRARQLHDETMQ